MARKMFKTESLSELDNGIMSRTLDKELANIAKHCDQRPTEDKPRKVQLTLSMVPVADPENPQSCEYVLVTWDIKTTVPGATGLSTRMIPKHDGKLEFNPDSADAPDQRTLDEIEPEKGKKYDKGE